MSVLTVMTRMTRMTRMAPNDPNGHIDNEVHKVIPVNTVNPNLGAPCRLFFKSGRWHVFQFSKRPGRQCCAFHPRKHVPKADLDAAWGFPAALIAKDLQLPQRVPVLRRSLGAGQAHPPGLGRGELDLFRAALAIGHPIDILPGLAVE